MTMTQEKIIQIMIVDDHSILVESMTELINGSPKMQVVSQASSGKEALKLLREPALKIDVVLMDLKMEDQENSQLAGLTTAKKILTEIAVKGVRDIRIIIITQILDGFVIDLAYKMGVHGYLLKECGSDELFNAIELVSLGKRRHFMGIVAKEHDNFIYDGPPVQEIPKLTHVEKEVLSMIAEGLTTKEIATRRGRGEDGIEAHRRNMMKKFRAKNSPHMISLAYQFGYIKSY